MKIRLCLIILLAGLIPAPVDAQSVLPVVDVPGPLVEVLRKKIPLLLFAKSRSDARMEQQLELLRARRAELSARNMVVLQIVREEDVVSAIGYVTIATGSNHVLREFYQPDPKRYTAILIDRKGRELGRWTAPVEPRLLFDLADQANADGNGS
jgi:hypothetical protein